MTKQRLEAFSDGVIAILLTIMVLELRAPEGGELSALRPVMPSLLGYLLSFVYLGIYWNNHHHMLHVTHQISGGVLWANLHLLFWLSLVPFLTSWMAEHYQMAVPTAVYGVNLLLAAIAYTILQTKLIAIHGNDVLARAVQHDGKGKASIALYAGGIALAFVRPWIAQIIYVIVALVWLVPDRRIERHMHEA
ncbi:MAG TPA: TMEM175 family protein [Thermoanaerobaculia bacterium]|nr:TMEM175 family protein [Thermoanaerobaculia bacterium]